MDNNPERGKFEWLPEAMPGVAALVREKRKLFGAAHVSQCWQKGVLELVPGWFFAREGALTIGTPFEDADLMNLAKRLTATQATLLIRNPEVNDGTHP